MRDDSGLESRLRRALFHASIGPGAWPELERALRKRAASTGSVVDDDPSCAPRYLRASTPEEEAGAAAELARLAAADDGIRRLVEGWLDGVESDDRRVDAAPTDAVNTVSGADRIAGPVVQAAGGISGGVHFHVAGGTDRIDPPNQLPAPRGNFVDRAQDGLTLDALREEGKQQVQTIVVTGLAGVGKTALTVRWLQENRAEFPDGLLHADLKGHASGTGPRSPGSVLGHLLRSMGVTDPPARDDERALLWRSSTHRLRLAVLADDALSAAQVRPLLPTGAGSLLVATSRNNLSGLLVDGARLHRLGPLDDKASLALLASGAGSRIGDDPEGARQVVRLCAHLPLALCLASAQLAVRPRRPVGQLATALAAGKGPLHTLRVDGEPTVGAALEESYRALPDDVARAYRQLGLLPATSYDRTLFDAVLGVERTERAVRTLEESNLLEDDGPEGHRFHDLVQAHARQRGEAEESPESEAETVGRYVDWCLANATAAEAVLTPSHCRISRTYCQPAPPAVEFAGQAEALEWLAVRRYELEAAVRYCATAGWDRACWQLVDAMWPLFLRLRPTEWWVEAHELGWAAARRAEAALGESRMLTSGAAGLRNAGRHREAGEWFGTALRQAVRDGDARQQSQALNGLGNAYLALGELPAAEDHFARALALRQEIGYRRGVALSRVCLGKTALGAGDPESAVDHLRRARSELLEEADAYDAARAQAFLGRALHEAGRHKAGDEQLRHAAAEFDAAGAAHWHARAWEFLAHGARSGGERTEARRRYARARALYEPLSPADVRRIEEQMRHL